MNYFNDGHLRTFGAKNYLRTGGLLYRVPAKLEQGFNFEYLLFIPNGIKPKTSLILESMNYAAGETTNPSVKIEYMYESFKGFKNSLHLCNQNSLFPVLYPLIPRYYDGNLQEEIYLNMLSSNSFKVTNKLFEQVDLQIIAMIHDAKDRLAKNHIQVDNRIIIHGFSGSAKFANRFALLHPEIIKLVIAGGLGGTLILPLRNIENEELLYPIGIGNFAEITNEKINKFKTLKQFYYQGQADKVDAFESIDDTSPEPIPYYKGIITTAELKQLHRFLGKDIATRWTKSKYFYKTLCPHATLKTYANGRHNLDAAVEDIKKLLDKETTNSA